MRTMLLVINLLLYPLAATAGDTEVPAARQYELLYFLKHDCGSCHGMTLKGGLGPPLLPENLTGKPKQYLVTTIMEGRENTAMPAWKSLLNKDEACWLSEQLQNGRILKTEITEGNK